MLARAESKIPFGEMNIKQMRVQTSEAFPRLGKSRTTFSCVNDTNSPCLDTALVC